MATGTGYQHDLTVTNEVREGAHGYIKYRIQSSSCSARSIQTVFGLVKKNRKQKRSHGYEKETLTHPGTNPPTPLSFCLQSNCRPLDRILIAQIKSAAVHPRWRRLPRTLPRVPFGTLHRTDARGELMRTAAFELLLACRACVVSGDHDAPKKGRYGEGYWLAKAVSETTKSSVSVDKGGREVREAVCVFWCRRCTCVDRLMILQSCNIKCGL